LNSLKRYYGFAAGSTAAEELTTIDLFRTRIAIMANEVSRLIWKAFGEMEYTFSFLCYTFGCK